MEGAAEYKICTESCLRNFYKKQWRQSFRPAFGILSSSKTLQAWGNQNSQRDDETKWYPRREAWWLPSWNPYIEYSGVE